MLSRRRFINHSALFSGSLLIPGFLKAWENELQTLPAGKVVVIIQLSGGNDGLNTVIPVNNDIYYRERPVLGIKKAQSLLLNDDAGLHPALKTFHALYNEGNLAVLNSVGYPNPDRSHFRSMDIWQTASNADEYVYTGWLGRYLDATCKACDHPTQILELDDTLSLALKGDLQKGIALKDPQKLFNTTKEKYFTDLSAAYGYDNRQEQTVDYLYKTLASTLSSASYIHESSKLKPSKFVYPSTTLGNSLKSIAGLICSDINTKVYYVSLGSFDTHAGQQNRQERLLKELDDAVKVFTDDLKKNGRFKDLLLFTFSEFGRRVAQNGSNGTDHGTANNMFIISGGLKQKGLINPLPDLSDLEDGDLKYKVDFRDVYATILKKWMNADDQMILGKRSGYLDFI
jgi:uncharacterized protein (DUF1501 family)